MSFDEIPEDQVEGYPCDCGGSVTKCDGKWCCDSCGFESPVLELLPKQSKPAKLLADKNKCPDCGRSKAHNAQDILDGACPKWYAIKDPEAENDCKKIRKKEKGG